MIGSADPDSDSHMLSDDAILADWVDEVTYRLRSDQSIDWDSYIALRPDLAQRLRSLMPVIVRMRGLDDTAESNTLSWATSKHDGAQGIAAPSDYEILREIGRGGMGIVYEAVQRSLGRHVALKILPPTAMIDRRQIQRFQLEAKAAALLQHDRIVQVHAVGCEQGIPFYAMEYIQGRSLAQYIRELAYDRSGTHDGCSEVPPTLDSQIDLARADVLALAVKPLIDPPSSWTHGSLASRQGAGRAVRNTNAFSLPRDSQVRTKEHLRTVARLGLQAAEALAYAHEQGVVHRDIKPGNLLVDARGNLWVTDFGLARVQANPSMTATGTIVGTLRYMSPEQSGAFQAVVDHRTDVYSLGATLYELLTLRSAIVGCDAREVLRRIAEEEPPQIRSLNPAVSTDLETIVMKAMAKDVTARYTSADAMADDLRRFLAGEPIRARPTTRRERLAKWARRRPAEAFLAGMCAAVLIGVVASAIQWNVSLRRHNSGLKAAVVSAERQEHLARRRAYAYQIKRANEARLVGDNENAQFFLDDLRTERVGFEWCLLQRLANREVSVLFGHQNDIQAMALSADKQTVVTGDYDGNLIFWHSNTLRPYRRIQAHEFGVQQISFSPSGQVLLTVACGPNRSPLAAKLWDVKSGSQLTSLLGIKANPMLTSFTPNSRRLAILDWPWEEPGPEPRVLVWELAELPAKVLLPAETRQRCAGLAYSSDGRWVASANSAGLITLRDQFSTNAGVSLLAVGADIRELLFSPDGRLLVAAHSEGVTFWETHGPRELGTELPHVLTQSLFSPSGRFFAAIGLRPNSVSWELVTVDFGKPRASVHTELLPGFNHCLAFSPDEKQLAVGGEGFVAFLHDLESSRKVRVFPGKAGSVRGLLYGAEGRSLFFARVSDERLRVWHLHKRPEPTVSLAGHDAEVWSLTFSPDGQALVSAGDDHLIKIWDNRTGAVVRTLRGHDALVTALAISADSRRLASASFDKGIRIWDPRSGELLRAFKGHTDPVRSVAITPDGRIAASGSGPGRKQPDEGDADHSVRLWDLETGQQIARLDGHTRGVSSLVFAPDGKLLFSASGERMIRIWDVEARCLAGVVKSAWPAQRLALSPDASLLASGDEHGNILIWETATWLCRSAKGSDATIYDLRFSPDGLTLAAACGDARIRLWETTTLQELLALEGHSTRVNAVAFSPDGLTMASGSHDGAVKLWRAGTP